MEQPLTEFNSVFSPCCILYFFLPFQMAFSHKAPHHAPHPAPFPALPPPFFAIVAVEKALTLPTSSLSSSL